jgi:hypothetical protein
MRFFDPDQAHGERLVVARALVWRGAMARLVKT